MTNARVALATCSQLPDLDKDDAPLIGALAERGVTAEPAVWDDPAVDWQAYDLVLVRSTWDYSPRHDEFLAWARALPKVANSADVIEWNTDKRYLRELEAAGIPVIPTIWLDPARHLSKRAVHTRMPAFGDFVVKPVVSAGAKNTGRYQPVSAQSRGKAIAHATRLLDDGRWVMIQPYVTSVDTTGETCLIFIEGELTHAVRKNALLTGPAEESGELYAEEEMESFEATPAQIDVAQRALAVAREATGADLTYARVDLVSGDDGEPMVIELELTEPSLWMRYGSGVEGRLADAVVKLLG
ncbi:RimK family alpha-L-glutamate ligase [Promicromonospora sp. Populi]|uniref:ATP-grasp domain-containing protein n=1 Tax=Promicromonospora sp. Populi TaxID=3239420 RepID=UPI0034E1D608